MYSEIKHIFFSTMSNPDLFLIKDDDKQDDISINFEIVKRPAIKFCYDSVPNSSESHSRHQEQEKKEEEEEEDQKEGDEEQRRVEFEVKQPEAEAGSSLREQDQEELEDGFRTPTSLDHRIPVAKQCPPAPRKPKISRKRKPTSQNSRSCRHPLDLSEEIEFELLFPIQHVPLSDSNQNAKKVRRENPE